MRRAAPFIPSDGDVHSDIEKALSFPGLSSHLSSNNNKRAKSNDMTDATDNESSGSSAGNDLPIDGTLITTIIS